VASSTHPVRVPVPGTALHLRPIREADAAIDYPAVMGSRERLWEIFGPAWGWPAETMTFWWVVDDWLALPQAS